jgi:hypothetical protein
LRIVNDVHEQGLGAESRPASLFTAVEELGLKVESAKAPLEVVVIDSVQRPTENSLESDLETLFAVEPPPNFIGRLRAHISNEP